MKRVSLTLLGLIVLFPQLSDGQQSELSYIRNIGSYQTPKTYTQKDGQEYNEQQYWTHPDFGRLTFSAPYEKHVVEDISKRTLDERYYVDLDDPTFFYIEKSSIPINYMKDGYLRAIDPSLYLNNAGYSAPFQPNPTQLNIVHEFTAINRDNSRIQMNQDHLKATYLDNSVTNFYPDWSQIQVTNFEAYITDYFPDIDKRITFHEGGVKSEYIVKHNSNYKTLEFIDDMTLSSDLEAEIDDQNAFLNILSKLKRYPQEILSFWHIRH